MSMTESEYRAARRHLSRRDPVQKELIRRVGVFKLQPQRPYFQVLVRAIVSQQISRAAARTILKRLHASVAPHRLSPEVLVQRSVDELRETGLSRQKASYVLDLAERVNSGEVRLRRFSNLDDEDVIESLTRVKGIGRWTAQMFLMFSLMRHDILPEDDLGIRAALQRFYALGDLPDRETMREIAEPWRPYATVACWYCWRGLDLPEDGA